MENQIKTRKILKKNFRREFSAGGVVFKQTLRGPKIAFILDPFRRWAFAKGHLQKGETPREAALRETSEEMGLPHLRQVKYLGRVHFEFIDRFVHKGALIHKLVYYYLMEAPKDAKAKPERAEKIYRVRWVTLDRAPRTLSYTNTKKILTKAIKEILKMRSRHVLSR